MTEIAERFEQAKNWRAEGRLAEAVDALRAVTVDSPGHAKAWRLLAETLGEQGEAGESAAALRAGMRAEAAALTDIAAAQAKAGQDTPARALLAKALTVYPDSPEALWLLGSLQRAAGELDAALATFERYDDADPGRPAIRQLIAALGGGAAMRAPGEGHAWPSPFVQLRDFLPRELHDRLLQTALDGRPGFIDSTVRAGDYQPDVRRSHVSHDVDALREWFVPLLRERLEEVRHRLGIAPFTIERVETQLTAHNDGNFYDRHRDNDLVGVVAREISFIYYFNRSPKGFTGGELLIFDTEPNGNYAENLYTRLTPHDNSIVLFPSGYVHQVRPVACPSGDWADSRFTFNGWVRRYLTPEELRRDADLRREAEMETAAE